CQRFILLLQQFSGLPQFPGTFLYSLFQLFVLIFLRLYFGHQDYPFGYVSITVFCRGATAKMPFINTLFISQTELRVKWNTGLPGVVPALHGRSKIMSMNES